MLSSTRLWLNFWRHMADLYDKMRPLLFRLDPERAHSLTLVLLRLAGALPPVRAALGKVFGPVGATPVQAFGLTFPNRVGLAAGYDKDGLAWRGLAALGFGHIEVGTVTSRPQSGNPRPRLFRLPEDQAIINRMGFPGRGADFVAGQLGGRRPSGVVLGVNLGKNKATLLADAYQDYVYLVERFAPLADYLTINISSPNTVGLRRLQGRAYLTDLLTRVVAARDTQATKLSKAVPLLVKLSPDLDAAGLDDALAVILESGVDGIIATNTTIARPLLQSTNQVETGGLSGAPLTQASTALVAEIVARTAGRLPVVAVGGIMTAADAQAKLDAGAALVQVYSGLIYRGPGLVREIVG